MQIKLLNIYLNAHFRATYDARKLERIGRVDDMEISTHFEESELPFFRIRSRDGDLDAKFKVMDGEYIGGNISGRGLKTLGTYFRDPKVRPLLDSMRTKLSK